MEPDCAPVASSCSSSVIIITQPVGDQDLSRGLSGESSVLTLPFQDKPNRSSREYASCYALFIVFITDDLGDCLGEAKPIGKELEENWGFCVEFYEIPFIGSQRKLQGEVEKAVASFIQKYDGGSNLILVHYGGHGYVKDELFNIAMGNDGTLYEIRLKPIREQFLRCKADVGIILDACESAAGSYRNYHHHSVEVLAACVEGGLTPAVGPKSFSNAILKVLRSCEKDTLSLSELRTRLVTGGKYLLETEPVHCTLKNSTWGRITLRRTGRAPDIKDLIMESILRPISDLRCMFKGKGETIGLFDQVIPTVEVEENIEAGFVMITVPKKRHSAVVIPHRYVIGTGA